jgi:Uma2 family endonuclease
MDRDSRDSGSAYPQAPSQEEWEAMTPEQQAHVVRSLAGEVTDEELAMPEGDRHFQPKLAALLQLKDFFQRRDRKVYVASELPVYYPSPAQRFAPDLLVVLDVEPHWRDKWLVSHERKGLDWVLEVHAGGDRKKDALYNVKRYAQLGIPEYFIFDGARQMLEGYRLPEPGAKRYVRLKPRQGRYVSRVLGLELQVEDGLPWLWADNRRMMGTEELLAQARRAEELAQRAEQEARRAEAAERRVAELQAQLERLQRPPK